MTAFTVQIKSIQFARNEERGEDGAVWYLLLTPYSERPCRHVCATHPMMEHHYERQAFRLGSSGHRLNATAEELSLIHI